MGSPVGHVKPTIYAAHCIVDVHQGSFGYEPVHCSLAYAFYTEGGPVGCRMQAQHFWTVPAADLISSLQRHD